MRARQLWVIAKRDYLARVRTRAFWLSTALVPLLILAVMFLPALMMLTTKTVHRLVVVDETGEVGPLLVERLEGAELPHEGATSGELRRGEGPGRTRFEVELVPAAGERQEQQQELNRRILAGEIHAWLWIGEETLTDSRVAYHAESVSNVLTQELLRDEVSESVTEVRLRRAGYDPVEIQDLATSIRLTTVRVTAAGVREEAGFTGMILAYALFFLLYTMLAVYGQQVMTGVLEEKGSRIVEIVASAARPFELMLGKIVGIGAVGLTQLAIWLGTAAAVTAPAVVASLPYLPEGFQIPTLSPSLLAHFLALFLLGYFMFATFYAAIGAAYNNLQEAQQMGGFVVMLLIVPLVFFFVAVNDPDALSAVVASMVPLFTPLLMMVRIAVKTPPVWQIVLAYLLTTGFTLLMVWFCAKIYRVGLLMYGKKPTVRDLWRWVRYA